jgi:CheY-like chemotaxis protein
MAKCVVVIDDSRQILAFLQLALTDDGWEVFGYTYTESNLVLKIAQAKPDVIILDLNAAQRGGGWSVLQLLRMDNATAVIPILVYTTFHVMPAHMISYLAFHNIEVVYKPFDLNRFIETITSIVASHAGRNTNAPGDLSTPILVVEDDDALREGIALILRMEGYSVVTAVNGQEAFDLVTHAHYCLILLDIHMPVMDGLQFLAAYDAVSSSHIPVIVLSAQASSLKARLPSFVVHALDKPYSVADLLKLVRTQAHVV